MIDTDYALKKKMRNFLKKYTNEEVRKILILFTTTSVFMMKQEGVSREESLCRLVEILDRVYEFEENASQSEKE